MKKKSRTAQQRKATKPRRWSAKVMQHSDAMDLMPGVFKRESPKAIAESILRSAKRSKRRKASPYRSAMSMLTFYINRAGHSLSKRRRQILEKAKEKLRQLRERGKA